MNDFIINFMSSWGYIALIILITLENIFPPIPSELILTFSGFMTTYSSMNIVLVILFSTLGSLIGASMLYLIGKCINVNKLKKMCNFRFFKFFNINESDIDKASYWFENKGEYTVFFCRFIPIVRSLISIPAGINKMNFVKFIVFTFYGSAVWNGVLCVLGSAFGKAYPIILKYVGNFSKIILLLIVLFFIYFIFKMIKNR
ncbi:MAG: DedA family protein [Bacilli bacterium]|nr:DedA family protein [Bacilli bacterium]